MRRQLIVKAGEPREIAVVENGRLAEFISDTSQEDGADAIWLGKVVRMAPGMGAAFVDIGQQRNGFLPIAERSESFFGGEMQPGSRVLVQVRREAHGEKGAFLTRDLTLPGEYALLMPCNRYIGVSARVTGGAEKARLRRMGERIADGRFGLVMRAACLTAGEKAVEEEIETLWETARQLQTDAATAHCPSLVHGPRSAMRQLLDDYLPRGLDEILTDDQSLAGMDLPCPVRCVDTALPDWPRWLHERDQALKRRVWLKSGGNLCVDICEALTVIDVNTAKLSTGRDAERNLLKTNLEACGEIALQLRLRALSGIILIDMIDMQTEQEREQVLSELTRACAADRVKTVVHGFTSLGLIEMTRKRSGRSLQERYGKAPADAENG